jgi:CHAD domain-containing protein
MGTFHEVEVAFEVDDDVELPDLRAVPGIAAVQQEPDVLLVADYLDTAGRDLLRAGITLRRRTGGSDAGWHLKVPAGAPDGADLAHTGSRDRIEHRAPVQPATAPAELLDLVRARLHGAALVPLAQVRTRRTVHRLLDPDGRPVLEVCDDRVVGSPGDGGDGPGTTWREWEVELVGGEPAQLAAAAGLLRAAGRAQPRTAGKVARTLGAAPAVRTTARDDSAGEVVRAYLAVQVEQLFSLDAAVRAGDDDAVHDARIATRRLRAVLHLGRAALGADRVDAVVATLGSFGRLLGAARDPAVEAAAFRQRAAADAPLAEIIGLDPAPARRRLGADRSAARRRGLRALRGFMTGPEFDTLAAALVELADGAPTGPGAGDPAAGLLRAEVRRRDRALVRALRAAAAVPAGPSGTVGRDVALHEVRKRARQARYAAEVAAVVLGRPARRAARRYQAVQDLLGTQHDTVVRRATLLRVAEVARRAGESGVVYGRWYALEEVAAEHAELAALRAARRATSPRNGRWLR